MYILAKAKYQHSIVYGFTYKKLGRMFGVDAKTAKRYVGKLIDFGFAEIHGGNLLFVSQSKIVEKLELNKKVDYIETRPWTTLNGVLDRLDYVTILHNAKQQDFNASLHSGKLKGNLFGRREQRKLIHKITSHSEGEIIEKDFVEPETEKNGHRHNSSRQIGRLLNVSHQQANRILHSLKKKKYIEYKERMVKTEIDYRDKSKGYYWLAQVNEMSKEGFYFLHQGAIYLHQGIQIKFVNHFKSLKRRAVLV